MKPPRTYTLEVLRDGDWRQILSDPFRAYVEGYAARYLLSRPRPAFRVVRYTGGTQHTLGHKGGERQVLDDYEAADDLDIGLIAGSPSVRQLVDASLRALRTAAAKALRDPECGDYVHLHAAITHLEGVAGGTDV